MSKDRLAYMTELLGGKPDTGEAEMIVDIAELRALKALADAVMDWCSDCEGVPKTPSDARLIKAIWTFDSGLDRFIEEWSKKRPSLADAVRSARGGDAPPSDKTGFA